MAQVIFIVSCAFILEQTYRVRRRQAASLAEQAAVLAEKRQRQEEAALLERQEIIGHYKHSVLGDKSAYVFISFLSNFMSFQFENSSSLPRSADCLPVNAQRCRIRSRRSAEFDCK